MVATPDVAMSVPQNLAEPAEKSKALTAALVTFITTAGRYHERKGNPATGEALALPGIDQNANS